MRENGKYRVLQSCYWMMINVVFGYTTFYLGGYGYSPGEVGVLTAAFSAISAVCQPMLGHVADRSRRFNWKMILMLLAAACGLDLILLAIFKAKLLVGLLFGLMALLINCMMPMINAACFYYEKRGIHVDFGIARGMGSMFYAMVSLLLGWLTVRIGTSAIPAAGLPIVAVLFVTVLFMPCGDETEVQRAKHVQKAGAKSGKTNAAEAGTKSGKINVTEAGTKSEKTDTAGTARKSGSFLKKYPAFSVMILASALMTTVHNFMTTYLLQILERVGGDTGHLGVALAIGAVTEVPILFLFSHIVKRCPASKLLVISGFSYIVKSTMMLFAGSIGMIYAAHLLQPVSYALYASASVYFTDECMREEDKVTGQSLMTMTSAIGSVGGNLIGGWLIDFGGVTQMMTFCMLLAAVTVGIVITSAVMYGKTAVSR